MFNILYYSFIYFIALFIATKYFNETVLALLIGLVELAVGLGSYLAQNSYLYVLENFGWDLANLIIIIILFSLFLYLLFLFKLSGIEKTSKTDIKPIEFSKILSSTIRMFKSFTNLSIYIYSFLTWGIVMAFAGYWAKSYYVNMHHYSRELALSLSEIYWVSFLVSALILGYCVKNIGRAKKGILLLSLVGAIVYLDMAVPILFSYWLLVCISILSGICASGVVLAFFIVQYLAPVQEKGLAISINNFFIVMGGLFGQLIFSKAIFFNFGELFLLDNSINPYFYTGIVMLLIWSNLALIVLAFAIRKIK